MQSAEEFQRKQKCRTKTKWLIDTGAIARHPCEVCGSDEAETHHVDYDKPEQVKWLCRSHHTETHRGQKKTSEYSPAERARRSRAGQFALIEHHCERCGHNWIRKDFTDPTLPLRCARCKNYGWQTKPVMPQRRPKTAKLRWVK